MKGMEHIVSFSGGKDSTATVILAHEHNEPLDLIVFAEVMFSREISGELPEHIDFIKNKCFPLFREWGYKTEILHAEKTYMDCFHHVVEKPIKTPENKGKKKGFVMVGHCDVQRDCKIKAINDFFKRKNTSELIQYLGIAADEKKRLERLEPRKISLLQKYGYTEKMAGDLCREYDLLSPIYDFSPRGGCWFCPNAKDGELRHLRTHHRDLWNRLLKLEKEPDLIGEIWNTAHGVSMADNEERFYWEDAQMTIFDFLDEGDAGSKPHHNN